ncbi:MAG: putative CRISPR-associated protein [Candidatus Cloacimonadales bacterium]|jgi:putative CRISPR-associated protein (TIGR02619 family)|nr:putative CRISPR-associated protein [Candidatus Cloacimonadota bacterium]MDD2650989.1 putative CRISPR-associated protein [Candidatus Cloacimonadota bacterium]MDX9978106.1 putative CRISPR-associated protein [Candidatus Cloacimonadales bacterium]
MKNLLIISTCGTSILTNLNRNENLLFEYSNIKDISEIENEEERGRIQNILQNSKDKINGIQIEEAKKLSAELNGLFTYFKGSPPAGTVLYLVPTDTLFGRFTAGLIQSYFEYSCNIKPIMIEQTDLQTKDHYLFQNALGELSDQLSDIYETSKENYTIVYNLTGGFKSVNAFLQTVAQFYADESFYLFESAKELMKIPRLPVKLTIEDNIKENLSAIRKMAQGLTIKKEELQTLTPLFYFEMDEQYSLSVWGKSLWNTVKTTIYSEKLWESPTELVVFTDGFKRSIDTAKLTTNRIYEINKKVDDLMKFAYDGSNPESLDCKPLHGSKLAPSTHECDAWHDQDAKRIYFHKEGNKLILDKLDKALH